CTVDENRAAVPEVRLPQTRQCVEPSVTDWRSLLEANAGRHVRDSGALANAHEFRMRTEPKAAIAKGAVTDRELAHARPDRRDLSRNLDAQNPLPRPPDPFDEAAHTRAPHAAAAVARSRVVP